MLILINTYTHSKYSLSVGVIHYLSYLNMSQSNLSCQEFVNIAFGAAELFLEEEVLDAIGVVVQGQVQVLLELHTPPGSSHSAFPVETALMLSRAIGALGNNINSIKDRVRQLWSNLLLVEAKQPSYLKSIREQALTVTGFGQLNKSTILPRIKLLVKNGDPSCPDPIAFLLSLGFDEHSADTLYNSQRCKDVFSILLITLLYRFVDALPQPTGVQSLTGVPIADSTGPITDSMMLDTFDDPVRALRVEMVQMMREVQVSIVSQLTAQFSAMLSQNVASSNGNATSGPAFQRSNYERMEDDFQNELTFDQAIQEGDAGMAFLNRGIHSLNAGTSVAPLTTTAYPPQNTSQTIATMTSGKTSPGIDDAIRQLLANFQHGHDHMSPNDILMTILRAPGLFVIGIAWIVCTFSRPPAKHHSAANALVQSIVYNPDNISYLTCLPSRAKQFHLWPGSPSEFFDGLERENIFLQESTTVGYTIIPGHSMSQSCSIHLSRYKRRMQKLFDSVLLGHYNSAVQSNPHHVTLYYLLLCFHYNMWTRAVVHKDLRMLLESFDSLWTLHYAPLMGTDATGSTMIRLSTAMQALSYCCESCNRSGSCIQLCTTAECRAQHGLKTEQTPTAGGTTGFMKSFNAWKALPTNKGKTDQAFRLTDEFKALPPAPPKATKTKGVTFDSLQHRQNEIKMPAYLELSF